RAGGAELELRRDELRLAVPLYRQIDEPEPVQCSLGPRRHGHFPERYCLPLPLDTPIDQTCRALIAVDARLRQVAGLRSLLVECVELRLILGFLWQRILGQLRHVA